MVEKQADGESKWPLLPSAPCCNKCVSTAAGFSPQDEQTVIAHYLSVFQQCSPEGGVDFVPLLIGAGTGVGNRALIGTAEGDLPAADAAWIKYVAISRYQTYR
jgi:hypothetical protein